jgi:uncharacterized integral membrane protein
MVRLIIGIIIGALAIVFIAQNPQVTDITFLAWTVSMSRALMMLLTLIAGIIIGLFLGTIGRRRRRAQQPKQK